MVGHAGACLQIHGKCINAIHFCNKKMKKQRQKLIHTVLDLGRSIVLQYLCVNLCYLVHIEKPYHVLVTSKELFQFLVLIWMDDSCGLLLEKYLTVQKQVWTQILTWNCFDWQQGVCHVLPSYREGWQKKTRWKCHNSNCIWRSDHGS